MRGVRLVGAIVLTLGILALVYGGFTYTKETHDAKLGPLEVQVHDTERVDIPMWLGVAATVIGSGALLFGRPKVA